MAASAALAFVVSVDPARWTRSLCDAIAINSAAAVICAGLALALAGYVRHERTVARALAVAGAGSVALAVFLLFEPRCIRGPFVMADPAIWPIWLDQVREFQPLLTVLRINPLTGAAMAAFPV